MSYCNLRHTVMLLLLALAGCATPPVSDSVPVGEAVAGAAPGMAPAAAIDPSIQTQFDTAVEDLRQNRLSDARVKFEQIVNQHPEFSGPLLNLGIIALREGDREAAAGYFNKALEGNPANTEALNFLGVMAREGGRFTEAENYYRKALEVDPKFASAHLNLGMLLELYLGQFEEALQHYETYQSLQSEPDPKVKNWIADLNNRLK
jgi:Flp pilus assembly protein TadD